MQQQQKGLVMANSIFKGLILELSFRNEAKLLTVLGYYGSEDQKLDRKIMLALTAADEMIDLIDIYAKKSGDNFLRLALDAAASKEG